MYAEMEEIETNCDYYIQKNPLLMAIFNGHVDGVLEGQLEKLQASLEEVKV